MRDPRLYGLLAEFDDPTALVHAARVTREAGYTRLDAYTPYPIEELHDALALPPNRLALFVLIGGVLGGLGGYLLQWWTSVVDYPLNVGGRPLHSWPSFVPVTFETTVLAAALACTFGMIALNGLPMPYHPLFNVPRFAFASRDRFFLCIEADDPLFDRDGTRRFLERFVPRQVLEVED